MLQIARRRTFGRGEIVFHEGDPSDSFHLIFQGRFAARVRTRLGDSALLSIVGQGETFGELALVGETGARSATVMALEAAETRSIYVQDFARLRRSHPTIDAALVELLAEQVRRLSRRVLEGYYLDADTRVRLRLVELAAVYGGDEPTPPVRVPLTQEDIADLAGTTRVTVNRVLREQEKLGTLEIGRGRTVLLDIAAIRGPGHRV